MRLLLHACCGPCSLEPVRLLTAAGHDVTIANINPNIQPRAERIKRAETLADAMAAQGVEVIQVDMDPAIWERSVAPLGMSDDRRCRACYAVRFEEAARIAGEKDAALSTTLSVSPYQDTEGISLTLRNAGSHADVDVLDLDLRPWYEEATRISREDGLYRQNSCGCRYSAARSVMDRARFRDERKQQKLVARMERRGAASGSVRS